MIQLSPSRRLRVSLNSCGALSRALTCFRERLEPTHGVSSRSLSRLAKRSSFRSLISQAEIDKPQINKWSGRYLLFVLRAPQGVP